MNLYWASGGMFVIYLISAFAITGLTKLTGSDLWLLRSGLATMGITSYAIFYYFIQKRQATKQAAASAVAAAGGQAPAAGARRRRRGRPAGEGRRSQAGRLQAGHRIQARPLAGHPLDGRSRRPPRPPASCAPALSRNCWPARSTRTPMILPTRAANIWFARGAIFFDTSGRLIADSARWVKLIKKLQPGKLRSVVGKGGQAPRAAIVCVDLERLMQAGDQATLMARNLQARLGEISQTLGVNFPGLCGVLQGGPAAVLHRMGPHAEQRRGRPGVRRHAPGAPGAGAGRVRRGRNQTPRVDFQRAVLLRLRQAHRVSGARARSRKTALRLRVRARVSQGARLGGPVSGRSVPAQPVARQSVSARLLLLGRARDLRHRAGFAALDAAHARQFLVSKPGRRTPPACSRWAPGSKQQQPTPQSMAQPTASVTKKVPQWVFLTHFFNSVVLQDHAAMGASGASTKASGARRALLAAAAALCLLMAFGFTWSFFRNRALESRALGAARGVQSAEGVGGQFPSVDALKRLETLRATLRAVDRIRARGRAAGLSLVPLRRQRHVPARPAHLLQQVPPVDVRPDPGRAAGHAAKAARDAGAHRRVRPLLRHPEGLPDHHFASRQEHPALPFALPDEPMARQPRTRSRAARPGPEAVGFLLRRPQDRQPVFVGKRRRGGGPRAALPGPVLRHRAGLPVHAGRGEPQQPAGQLQQGVPRFGRGGRQQPRRARLFHQDRASPGCRTPSRKPTSTSAASAGCWATTRRQSSTGSRSRRTSRTATRPTSSHSGAATSRTASWFVTPTCAMRPPSS